MRRHPNESPASADFWHGARQTTYALCAVFLIPTVLAASDTHAPELQALAGTLALGLLCYFVEGRP